MEGRREYVETSPSPFSSAVSPPREIEGVPLIWSTWTVRSHTFWRGHVLRMTSDHLAKSVVYVLSFITSYHDTSQPQGCNENVL